MKNKWREHVVMICGTLLTGTEAHIDKSPARNRSFTVSFWGRHLIRVSEVPEKKKTPFNAIPSMRSAEANPAFRT